MIKKKVKFNNYNNCLLNDEIILKSQQRFKSKARNVFTEEINKIVLSNNDDKKLQTFDKITLYFFGTNVGKKCKTELLEYLNIKWWFNDATNENTTEHNTKWPYIPDHSCRISITGGSGHIYLYVKDPYEAKYQFLIKREKVGLKHYNDPKVQMICKRIEENCWRIQSRE